MAWIPQCSCPEKSSLLPLAKQLVAGYPKGDDGTACDGTMETTDGFEEGNDLTWCTLSCSAWGLGMCGADCDSGDLRGVEGDLRGVGGLDTAAAVTVAVITMLVGTATLGVMKTEAGEEGSDVTMATVFEMALALTLDCLSFIGWSSGGGLVGVGTLKEAHLGEGVGTGLNSSGTMAGHDGEEGTGEGRGLDPVQHSCYQGTIMTYPFPMQISMSDGSRPASCTNVFFLFGTLHVSL